MVLKKIRYAFNEGVRKVGNIVKTKYGGLGDILATEIAPDRAVASTLLLGSLIFTNVNCGGTSDSGGEDPDPDQQVVWDSSYDNVNFVQNKTTVISGASAHDPDGMPVVYSKVSGPSWITVNPANANLTGTPTDEADVGGSHEVVVRADDGTKPLDYVEYFGVDNTQDVTGKVLRAGDRTPIEGVKVTLGAEIDYTDALGEYEFLDQADGDSDISFEDPSANYLGLQEGFVRKNQVMELSGNNTGIESILVPVSHDTFLEDTVMSSRSGNKINKFLACPTFDIYTKNVFDGSIVDSAKVDLVTNILKTKLSNRFGYEITDSEININATPSYPPVGQPDDGHVKIYWDDGSASGSNVTWLNGNEILSASISGPTSSTLEGERWISELVDGLTNANDSNLYTSTRNDPLTPGLVDPSSADDIVDDANKSYMAGAYNVTADMIANPAGTLVYKH